jgi:uncharacterized membrane protein YbaN (DUF454 family)
MSAVMGKIVRIIIGIFLTVIGILGTVVPIVPGFIFIISGLLLLVPDIPFLNKQIDKIYEKYPVARKYLDKF